MLHIVLTQDILDFHFHSEGTNRPNKAATQLSIVLMSRMNNDKLTAVFIFTKEMCPYLVTLDCKRFLSKKIQTFKMITNDNFQYTCVIISFKCEETAECRYSRT